MVEPQTLEQQLEEAHQAVQNGRAFRIAWARRIKAKLKAAKLSFAYTCAVPGEAERLIDEAIDLAELAEEV